MTDWREDQLAYDGQSRPQERELTPRERDILTRILSDIILQIHRVAVNDGHLSIVTTQNLDELMFANRLGGIRMDLHEVETIVNLREVLTPREE